MSTPTFRRPTPTPERASNCSASPLTPRFRHSPLAGSSLSRYYSGNPVPLAGTLYNLHDRTPTSSASLQRVVTGLPQAPDGNPAPQRRAPPATRQATAMPKSASRCVAANRHGDQPCRASLRARAGRSTTRRQRRRQHLLRQQERAVLRVGAAVGAALRVTSIIGLALLRWAGLRKRNRPWFSHPVRLGAFTSRTRSFHSACDSR
jgi:hypothetical protein